LRILIFNFYFKYLRQLVS